ncbi:uncharacterized protein B0P05DRAFT_525369 [Gilbertella persicaria]|uniref:uncharacterized protein n=1 Tax=Gilbertella persicaria TaxID=101096 RepID=UPI00221E3E94|nr:uncharacterized protein B0P05DRAFT_525369 [Gilbertella persicaria]KAI8092234.1 hypothetical protein B0P05DRAFT_525369 [Gilbertella persicaria]
MFSVSAIMPISIFSFSFFSCMDTQFAYETLAHIFFYLKQDQKTLCQLSLTCNKFRQLSLPLLFKHPHFTSLDQLSSFAGFLTEINGALVRSIDLHMVPHRWDATQLTQILYQITPKTPHLELLDLGLCTLLTDKALDRITRPLHELRILSIDRCELIGDESIRFIVNHCPDLEELHLGSTRITDNGLNVMADGLYGLTHLYMPSCQHITEKGLNHIMSSCKQLHHLDIKDCYNVVGEFRQQQQHDDDAWTDEE